MKNNKIDDILSRQRYIQENMREKSNPFDDGIMRAIRSAKQSVAMDSDQENSALRNSILSFSDALDEQKKTRGFMGNLAAAGRAMRPAIRTYNQHEDVYKQRNRDMLDYAQKLRAQEELNANRLEQEAYNRDMADRDYALKSELADRDHMLKVGAMNQPDTLHHKELIRHNIKQLDKGKEAARIAKIKYDALKYFGDVLKSAKAKGLTGTNILADVRRQFAKHISGDTREMTLNDMLKQAYMGRVKEFGGSNPNYLEFEVAMSTIPGIEKHYGASLEQVNKDIAESLNVMNNYNELVKQMNATDFRGYPKEIEYEMPESSSIGDNKPPSALSGTMDQSNSRLYQDQEGNVYAIPEGVPIDDDSGLVRIN